MNALKQYNKRIIEILEDAKNSGLVRNDRDWCKRVGIAPSNLSHARAGDRDFTIDQMVAAAKINGVSLDWVVGRTSLKYIPGKKKIAHPIKKGLKMI